jgi:hypothetical protein
VAAAVCLGAAVAGGLFVPRFVLGTARSPKVALAPGAGAAVVVHAPEARRPSSRPAHTHRGSLPVSGIPQPRTTIPAPSTPSSQPAPSQGKPASGRTPPPPSTTPPPTRTPPPPTTTTPPPPTTTTPPPPIAVLCRPSGRHEASHKVRGRRKHRGTPIAHGRRRSHCAGVQGSRHGKPSAPAQTRPVGPHDRGVGHLASTPPAAAPPAHGPSPQARPDHRGKGRQDSSPSATVEAPGGSPPPTAGGQGQPSDQAHGDQRDRGAHGSGGHGR